jgi:hypothetical protein
MKTSLGRKPPHGKGLKWVTFVALACGELPGAMDNCPKLLTLTKLGDQRLEEFVLQGQGGRLEGSSTLFPGDTFVQLGELPWVENPEGSPFGRYRMFCIQPSSIAAFPYPPSFSPDADSSMRGPHPVIGTLLDIGDALISRMGALDPAFQARVGMVFVQRTIIGAKTVDNDWHTHDGPMLALATAVFGKDDRVQGSQVVRHHPAVQGDKSLAEGIDRIRIAELVSQAKAEGRIDRAALGEISLIQCGLRRELSGDSQAPASLHAPQENLSAIKGETRFLVQWFIVPSTQ